jgi:ATP-dependent DNA helicase PIF1
MRTLGDFDRRLRPAFGNDGREAPFQRDTGYEASPGVQEALAAIDAAVPVVLITGRAGTGKTKLVQYLRERPGGDKQAIVAPTGIAALNARAQTIHSFFQLRPDGVLDPKEIESSRNTGKLFRHMERLVIDEISMVRVDVLDAIDVKLRRARGDGRPFGACRSFSSVTFSNFPL